MIYVLDCGMLTWRDDGIRTFMTRCFVFMISATKTDHGPFVQAVSLKRRQSSHWWLFTQCVKMRCKTKTSWILTLMYCEVKHCCKEGETTSTFCLSSSPTSMYTTCQTQGLRAKSSPSQFINLGFRYILARWVAVCTATRPPYTKHTSVPPLSASLQAS